MQSHRHRLHSMQMKQTLEIPSKSDNDEYERKIRNKYLKASRFSIEIYYLLQEE